MLNRLLARRGTALAVAALVPLLSLVSAPANATTPTILGATSLTPATGKASDAVGFETHAACPSGTLKFKVQLWTTGASPALVGNLVGTTALSTTTPNGFGGFSGTFAQDMATTLANDAITAPNGVYQVQVDCTDGTGFTVTGMMIGNVQIVHGATDNAGDGAYAYQPGALATPTTTGIAATAATVTYPTKVALHATVSPSSAAGTVQFKRGTTNIGTPVAVSGGAASLSALLLPGSYSITATFQPTDAEAYGRSVSSALPVVIKPGHFRLVIRPAITGTLLVGRTLTCAHGSWSPAPSSYTYVWKRGTRVIGTRSTYRTVAADNRHYLTCTVVAHRAYYANLAAASLAKYIR